jgi:hypothetical protein
MNLNTKLIVVIIAAGVIASTITMLGAPKVLAATAQIQIPSQSQQQLPVQQVPQQQQQSSGPATGVTPAAAGGNGNGPNCDGCVTTQNLADKAVTAQKIAPGAVSLSTQEIKGNIVRLTPGTSGESEADCPAGTSVTGGGFTSGNVLVLERSSRSDQGNGNGWVVDEAFPSGGGIAPFAAFAECAIIQP